MCPNDPDDWSDDALRWFYGGTPPADEAPAAQPPGAEWRTVAPPSLALWQRPVDPSAPVTWAR